MLEASIAWQVITHYVQVEIQVCGEQYPGKYKLGF